MHCSAQHQAGRIFVLLFGVGGAEPSLTAAEKVIVTPNNLKSYVWKCFGFWSVDCKLVEPTAKLVCKLSQARVS